MQTYLYKVKNDTGKILWGIAEAQSLKELKKVLRSNEYFFIQADIYNPRDLSKLRLNLDELLMFTHRLAYLIESGLPIIESLHILWKQSEEKDVQIIVSFIRKELEDGSTLQEAYNVFPKVFPPMYLALIGVAEIGAGLVKVLKKLSQYIQEQKNFIGRMQRATIYPTFVLGFALLVVVGMFVFVVPTFEKVIVRLNGQLPLITQILFGISKLLRSPLFILSVVFLTVVGIFLWRHLMKIDKFSYMVDNWKLKAPFLRKVLYPLSIGRFTRSLGLLIESGVPLLTAIDVAKKTVINKKIEQAVEEIKKQIIEGGTLYDAFKSTKIFPVILVDVMGIGERSGRLHQLLENVATHLEEEADFVLSKFLTYLEPILIIVLGGVVLTLFLGIYLPIFSIQNTLRGM